MGTIHSPRESSDRIFWATYTSLTFFNLNSWHRAGTFYEFGGLQKLIENGWSARREKDGFLNWLEWLAFHTLLNPSNGSSYFWRIFPKSILKHRPIGHWDREKETSAMPRVVQKALVWMSPPAPIQLVLSCSPFHKSVCHLFARS